MQYENSDGVATQVLSKLRQLKLWYDIKMIKEKDEELHKLFSAGFRLVVDRSEGEWNPLPYNERDQLIEIILKDIHGPLYGRCDTKKTLIPTFDSDLWKSFVEFHLKLFVGVALRLPKQDMWFILTYNIKLVMDKYPDLYTPLDATLETMLPKEVNKME